MQQSGNITLISDAIQQQFEGLTAKKITLGVTGFSRAGKTVFIGALAQALLTADAWAQRRGQGPLASFAPFENGRFRSAQIRDDIHSDLPQFPFRKVRDSLVGRDARWPEPTEGISRLVLDLDCRSKGWIKKSRRIQLELVDYPGEWLVDLPMLGQGYQEWSERMLTLARKGVRSAWSISYFNELDKIAAGQKFDEEIVSRLADAWGDYLQKAAAHGLTLNQPGRLLRPGTIRHSPVLRLAPLSAAQCQGPLGKGLAKRFEEYKRKVIKPFYNEHFAKMDRQIVLVDVLRSIQLGEAVFDEMLQALGQTLRSFRYGKNSLLSWLGRARTTHVLFVATKADHVTRGDRANLEQMLRRMLFHVDDQGHLRSSAAHYDVLALASIKATEDWMTKTPPKREILYGRPKGEDSKGQWDPGALPLDMPPHWSEVHFQFLEFLPASMPDAVFEGFPTINLGKALDFLIGEEFS